VPVVHQETTVINRCIHCPKQAHTDSCSCAHCTSSAITTSAEVRSSSPTSFSWPKPDTDAGYTSVIRAFCMVHGWQADLSRPCGFAYERQFAPDQSVCQALPWGWQYLQHLPHHRLHPQQVIASACLHSCPAHHVSSGYQAACIFSMIVPRAPSHTDHVWQDVTNLPSLHGCPLLCSASGS
jgi:hypothetical protein